MLAQRFWRRGKRGAWYDRLALVLMHHLARKTSKRDLSVTAKATKNSKGDDVEIVDDDERDMELNKGGRQEILKRAMDVIVEGLHDTDTHIGPSASNMKF